MTEEIKMKAQDIKSNIAAISKEIKAINEKQDKTAMDYLRREVLLTQRLQLTSALIDLGAL